ncbi:hydroxyacid dehydrogenase [Variovorax paradoxus]|uniref:hydroxyacid dehydrogenase n=1 Tax=Variovorax paradoxus TaxID=34073 RepID=UPI0019347944|nr:hydroxyacid dehydrogenase [Variovorax paradoxus]
MNRAPDLPASPGKAKGTILVTAPRIHEDAMALLSEYRVIQTGTTVSEDELVAICAREEPVAILARYGIFNERVFRASPRLKVISRHGVGMDSIDIAAAQRVGVAVEAAIGSNSQAVAEHAIGLMFACARKLAWLDQRMKQARWDKEGYLGLELQGATLGVIGCGSIGGRVAAFAKALGMKVLVCDPYLGEHLLPADTVRVELESLLRRSDVVSLHCPLNDETRGMLDASRLALLKDKAIVINTARAGLFDEAAMQQKLRDGGISLGLDCFVQEPLPADSAWLDVPNAVLTPHVGGTTDGGMRGMGVGAARNILRHLKEKT